MVAGVSFDENALLVFQSLRPYLGPRGNGCLIALESLLELLHSEPARKTLDSLRILGLGEGFSALTLVDESQKLSRPSKLFLAQILLFLADLPVLDGLYGVEPEEKEERNWELSEESEGDN